MGKIMRVNLSELKVRVEDMSKEYQGLGGRGLSSHIVGREVPPKTDPLGPENKLIFSAGILAGTAVPNTGRLSVGAKSPLTNGIKDANAGGSAAQKMARLGFQALVIEGREEELMSLEIDKIKLDSYRVKSENFLLTFHAPSPFPSPRWGEGIEGKISNMFGWDLFSKKRSSLINEERRELI